MHVRSVEVALLRRAADTLEETGRQQLGGRRSRGCAVLDRTEHNRDKEGPGERRQQTTASASPCPFLAQTHGIRVSNWRTMPSSAADQNRWGLSASTATSCADAGCERAEQTQGRVRTAQVLIQIAPR